MNFKEQFFNETKQKAMCVYWRSSYEYVNWLEKKVKVLTEELKFEKELTEEYENEE